MSKNVFRVVLLLFLVNNGFCLDNLVKKTKKKECVTRTNDFSGLKAVNNYLDEQKNCTSISLFGFIQMPSVIFPFFLIQLANIKGFRLSVNYSIFLP